MRKESSGIVLVELVSGLEFLLVHLLLSQCKGDTICSEGLRRSLIEFRSGNDVIMNLGVEY